MSSETIVDLEEIPVMYVAGDREEAIARQAPRAFEQLEAALPSLKGRKFYGIILGNEYRACVAVDPELPASALPFPIGSIPGGTYVRRKIRNWEAQIPLIGKTFLELCQRADYDPSRPLIEHYRSQKELFLLVPVK